MFLRTLILILVLFGLGCKSEVSPDQALLKKAQSIQTEGICEINGIKEILKRSDNSLVGQYEKKLEFFEKEMIEMPEAEHNHEGCNHDHKKLTVEISANEMIEVQRQWRDSIFSLKSKLIADLEK